MQCKRRCRPASLHSRNDADVAGWWAGEYGLEQEGGHCGRRPASGGSRSPSVGAYPGGFQGTVTSCLNDYSAVSRISRRRFPVRPQPSRWRCPGLRGAARPRWQSAGRCRSGIRSATRLRRSAWQQSASRLRPPAGRCSGLRSPGRCGPGLRSSARHGYRRRDAALPRGCHGWRADECW